MKRRLSDIGIITAASVGRGANTRISFVTKTKLSLGGKATVYVGRGSQMLVFATDKPRKIVFPSVFLTAVGQELLTLHSADIDQEMLRQLAGDLAQQEASLYLADARRDAQTNLPYSNPRPVAPASE